jgi:hypothetical protein
MRQKVITARYTVGRPTVRTPIEEKHHPTRSNRPASAGLVTVSVGEFRGDRGDGNEPRVLLHVQQIRYGVNGIPETSP